MSLRISVIGTNYLGATHAAGMAEFGHEVVGVDIDIDRVSRLAMGESPIFEDGLEPLLQRHTKSDRLRFSSDYSQIADWADIHFVCVGTPQAAGGAADLSQVWSAIKSLAPLLTQPTLVVGKSTVPVGTAAALQRYLIDHAPAGAGVELAWMPEFLREGLAVDDTLRPDRLVFGVSSDSALALLRRCFAQPLSSNTPEVVCDLATAELTKHAANAFLATKISFINALSRMCQQTGADVSTLADAIGHDVRIGRRFLDAGLGFGGGCLPKDVRALAARATELGVDVLADLLQTVEGINDGQRAEIADIAVDACGGSVSGKKIAVLGAAFKPGTDDTRNSPALEVAALLAKQGARIHIYDPQAHTKVPEMSWASNATDAIRDASAVLHLTDWPEFQQLDPGRLAQIVQVPLMVDARLKLNREPWQAAGWTVVQPGRPDSTR